jgi:hypothetical protein
LRILVPDVILLDKLTREEILDLIAYVLSGGDEQNKAFQGGQEQGGPTLSACLRAKARAARLDNVSQSAKIG